MKQMGLFRTSLGFDILLSNESCLLAECFLGAVSHVQEPIFFLESTVQRVHATSCTHIVKRPPYDYVRFERKKKEKKLGKSFTM